MIDYKDVKEATLGGAVRRRTEILGSIPSKSIFHVYNGEPRLRSTHALLISFILTTSRKQIAVPIIK